VPVQIHVVIKRIEQGRVTYPCHVFVMRQSSGMRFVQ